MSSCHCGTVNCDGGRCNAPEHRCIQLLQENKSLQQLLDRSKALAAAMNENWLEEGRKHAQALQEVERLTVELRPQRRSYLIRLYNSMPSDWPGFSEPEKAELINNIPNLNDQELLEIILGMQELNEK
jgi:hypothetical protein